MTELLVFGIVVSGFLILTGFRRRGTQLLMLVICCGFLGMAFEPVLLKTVPAVIEGMPAWVKIAGGGLLGLWTLQALLTVLFGKGVATTAVGTIVSQFVIGLARMGLTPFRWLSALLRLIGVGRG